MTSARLRVEDSNVTLKFIEEIQHVSGHSLSREFPGNGLASLLAKRPGLLRIAKQSRKPLCQRTRIIGLDKQPSRRSLDKFWEGCMVRLHDGYTGGEGFQNVQAETLAVGCGNGEDRQTLQQIELLLARHVAVKCCAVLQPVVSKMRLEIVYGVRASALWVGAMKRISSAFPQ